MSSENLNNPSKEEVKPQATGQEVEENYLKISLVNQGVSLRKRKTCPLKSIPLSEITYKNLSLLNKFLTERGKIISSRLTNVELKKQRAISKAIKNARKLALISPIKKDFA